MKNYSNMGNISPTLNSKLIYKKRLNDNLPVYNGGLGENPLPTPKYLLDIISDNLNKKEYSNIEGRDEFRNSVFSNYPEHMNNIIVGNGLKELIFSLAFNWSENIFIPTPCWVTYLEDMKLLKKNYFLIECDYLNNYKLDPVKLEQYLLKNNGMNSLLFLNNPTNPTGSVYSIKELNDLLVVFKKFNLTIFADEIYFNTSQIETISISKIYNNCIVGSSLSKDWASGGWRFGWMIFSKNLNNIHKKMVSFGSIMYSCPSDFFNDVAVGAITSYDNNNHFTLQKKYFKDISDKVCKCIKNTKIIHSDFQGAWYKWFDLREYSEKLNSCKIYNSQDLANYLGNNLGLIVVPGYCFGIEGLTFRLSMVSQNIHVGIQEMVSWLNS